MQSIVNEECSEQNGWMGQFVCSCRNDVAIYLQTFGFGCKNANFFSAKGLQANPSPSALILLPDGIHFQNLPQPVHTNTTPNQQQITILLIVKTFFDAPFHLLRLLAPCRWNEV